MDSGVTTKCGPMSVHSMVRSSSAHRSLTRLAQTADRMLTQSRLTVIRSSRPRGSLDQHSTMTEMIATPEPDQTRRISSHHLAAAEATSNGTSVRSPYLPEAQRQPAGVW